MKKLIFTTMIVAAFAIGQQPAGKQKTAASQAKVLTRAEFDQYLAKPDQVLLVDVRRPDEVSSVGGFPAYFSIQIGDLQKSLVWIPRERTIITISNHANRGGRAADILTKNGFKVAGAIGAQTYEEEGGKLMKVAPPPPAAGRNGAGPKN